ncbi:MAG: ATP-binding cassette domain-containing protein [Proteobacteria bacterium]|nr:ATP-binding cassette domain-containing protein [Pseudomonadota bacterium]
MFFKRKFIVSELIAQLVGVGHHYEEGPEIFKGVTLSIEKGTFHFLTGPSGSGKSSFLKILYLGLKPTWGNVKLFGKDTYKMPSHYLPLLRQKIGVVFQEFKLLDHLRVVDNVSLPLRVRGIETKRSLKHARELLDWVGLGDCLEAYPTTLSGGQKQRVAIARAVITRPQLLLADEPTGNVDDDMAMKLLYLFEELNKMGTAIIIATHNQRILEKFSYPQLFIKEGMINKEEPVLNLPKKKAVS